MNTPLPLWFQTSMVTFYLFGSTFAHNQLCFCLLACFPKALAHVYHGMLGRLRPGVQVPETSSLTLQAAFPITVAVTCFVGALVFLGVGCYLIVS